MFRLGKPLILPLLQRQKYVYVAECTFRASGLLSAPADDDTPEFSPKLKCFHTQVNSKLQMHMPLWAVSRNKFPRYETS
jgi:hypothetical protein